MVAFGRRDEPADLLQALGCQPLLPPPPLHSEAVRCLLIGSAELVPAFMRIDPQLYRRRYLGQKIGVENEEAGVSGPIVVELIVKHRRALAADEFVPIDLELPYRHDSSVATHFAYVFLGC